MFPSGIPRAPGECKIRWLGYLHPSINNGPWSPEETERLRDILGGDDTGKYPKDWVDIARRLGVSSFLPPKSLSITKTDIIVDKSHSYRLHAPRYDTKNTYLDTRIGPGAIGSG